MNAKQLVTAAEWNAKHLPGTAVRYYPVRGEMYSEDTETRSEAWELGHGAPVVKVKGRTGGVLLEHLQVLEEGVATATGGKT